MEPVEVDHSQSERRPQFRVFFVVVVCVCLWVFLTQSTRVFNCSYSPKASMQGWRNGLKVPKERLEWEALREDVEKQQPGVLAFGHMPPKTKMAVFPE